MGSRPDGWWRDRGGAARRLHDQLVASELGEVEEVVLVLEGAARRGPPVGREGQVRTVHATGSGDDAIVAEVRSRMSAQDRSEVGVVTADRELRRRVERDGAACRSPRWLLDQLSGP